VGEGIEHVFLTLRECADFLRVRYLGRRAVIRSGSFDSSSTVTVTEVRLIEGPEEGSEQLSLPPDETVLWVDFDSDAESAFLGLPPAGWLFFERSFVQGRVDPRSPEILFLDGAEGMSSFEPVGVAPRW